jgi:alkylation response protein AidB-like acyl-CoA dehydrogenase
MGADALTTGLIFEELTKEGDPNLTVNLGAAEVLIRHGSNSQRKYWLPKLASGKIRAGIASTEPRAGSDAASIVTSARKERKVGYPN